MSYYVYIVLCEKGSFYTGYTKDLEKRMKLHLVGNGARYTRMNKPKRLIYKEIFENRTKAMRREKAIKKLSHREKLKLVKSEKNKL
jgi:putative endonuclease